MARANGVPEWRLQYDIDFESVVRGHHIYKTVWKPEIGERLVCKKKTTKKRLHFMMKMQLEYSSSLRSMRSQNLFSSDIYLWNFLS